MTPLGRLIAARVRADGPITVADYMTECLLHPVHGYYTTRTPFGSAGDFVTAPEISQMFGELIGLALAQTWLDQGSPAPVTLAELGPGRGTLMADALRATRRVPGFHASVRIHLVEASPALAAAQRRALGGHEVTWLTDVAALPERPLLLVANEFFDALPIRQFVRAGGAWRERVVGLADEALVFGLTGPSAPAVLAGRAEVEGTLVEIRPAADRIVMEIARRVARGGAALVIDYGSNGGTGDTLQAVSRHAFADPLAAPGEADLTAHVDFAALAAAANGVAVHGPVGQGAFLERLGIGLRAERLATGLDGERLATHLAALRRLTDPAGMGTLFKVQALSPVERAAPPGVGP